MEVDVGDTSTAADGASTGGDAAAASLPLTAADGSPLPPWLLPPVTAAGSNTHPMLILGVDPSAALAAAAAEAEAAAEGRLLAAAGPGAAAGGGMAVLLASRLPYVPPASGAGKMWTQPIFVGEWVVRGCWYQVSLVSLGRKTCLRVQPLLLPAGRVQASLNLAQPTPEFRSHVDGVL